MDTSNVDASFQHDHASPTSAVQAVPSGTNTTVMALTTEFLWFANHLHSKFGRVLPDFKDITAVSAFAAAAYQEGCDTESVAMISAMLDSWSAMFREIREGPKSMSAAPVAQAAECSAVPPASPTIRPDPNQSRHRSPSPPCPAALVPGLEHSPSSSPALRSESLAPDPFAWCATVSATPSALPKSLG